MSENLKWEGLVTAKSSIVHGAESLGTVTYLRRERFLLPDGSFEEVPVISGNAWRGLLRDYAADLWWNTAGKPPLSLAVMHALWSGGALAKASGATLSGSRLVDVKNVCPVVGVFGTAGGGRIVGGSLQVGKMIPVCKELSHLIPKKFLPAVLPSMWDLTQIEYASRIPNVSKQAGVNDAGDEESDSSLARYGVETFVAGTQFYSWCSLSWASPLEQAFFNDVLAGYQVDGKVGGAQRMGHGQIALDLSLASGSVDMVDWASQIKDVPLDEMIEKLAWLD